MVPHYQEREKSNTRIFQKILQTRSHLEILCECWLFGKGMLCSDKLVGIMSFVKKKKLKIIFCKLNRLLTFVYYSGSLQLIFRRKRLDKLNKFVEWIVLLKSIDLVCIVHMWNRIINATTKKMNTILQKKKCNTNAGTYWVPRRLEFWRKKQFQLIDYLKLVALCIIFLCTLYFII